MSTHDYESGRSFVALNREIWLEPDIKPDGGVSAAFCWGHDFRKNPVSATLYFQYAETALRVGGAGTGGPFREPYLFPLRLECERLTDVYVGQSLWGQLWFALDPLPLYDLSVSRRLPNGDVFTDEMITDGTGHLTLPLTQTGDYLITVQGTAQEAAEHRYFDTCFGSMLSRKRRGKTRP